MTDLLPPNVCDEAEPSFPSIIAHLNIDPTESPLTASGVISSGLKDCSLVHDLPYPIFAKTLTMVLIDCVDIKP